MKNIISIGEVLIDVYTENSQDVAEVGGASFNVACSIGALNNNHSYFMGAMGNDFHKQNIFELMLKYNIRTDYVQHTSLPTTIAKVTLDHKKERFFKFIRNSDAELDLAKFSQLEFDKFDFIHFGSATGFLPGKLHASYKQLFNFALTNNIAFSFDPNFRDKLWLSKDEVEAFKQYCMPYLRQANVIKLSEDELTLLTETVDQEEAIKKIIKMNSAALICITRGSQDTLFAWKSLIHYVPVVLCENLVDTTGAGDSFIAKLIDGYVNYGINKNSDFSIIEKIIREANLFANNSVRYLGALTFLDNLTI